MEYIILLAIILSLVSLIVLGVPLAVSLAAVAFSGIVITQGIDGLSVISTITFRTVNNYVLTPIPLFIFMGELLIFSGISKTAFDVAYKWLGRLPGGLAVAGNESCALFAAISGSSPATTATVGLVSIPEMLKRGYDKGLATGSLAAGGALGVLIPPSILMIIYGVAAEQSVGQLFMAGLIPGIMLDIMMSLYIIGRCSLNPELGPRARAISWADTLISTWKLLPIFLLLLLILGTIYLGIATPTEAGGIGAFGALCLVIIYGKFTWSRLHDALVGTVTTTSFILLLFIAAHYFGYILSYLEIPQTVIRSISGLEISRWWIMIALNIMYIIMGCFMDPASIILITAPIVIPIIQNLGFDLIWFGIVYVVNMEMGNVTPPFGFNLYVLKGIVPKDVSLDDIIRGSLPFIVVQSAALALVMIFPQIILWLPSKMVPMS